MQRVGEGGLVPVRLALVVALSLASAGCPWDDPCYQAACGQWCTLCDTEDSACLQAEPGRVCNEVGLCVIAAPVCPPAQPSPTPR